VEKQNCGVSLGGGEGCAMMSIGVELDASTLEDFDQRKLASVKRASVNACDLAFQI
jgi:hypothetical protein